MAARKTEERFEAVEKEIQQVKATVEKRIGEFRTEMNQNLADVRQDLADFRQNLAELRRLMEEQMKRLRLTAIAKLPAEDSGSGAIGVRDEEIGSGQVASRGSLAGVEEIGREGRISADHRVSREDRRETLGVVGGGVGLNGEGSTVEKGRRWNLGNLEGLDANQT